MTTVGQGEMDAYEARGAARDNNAAMWKNASMSTQIIVAGFHRSGTSLTAQILCRAGVFLGYRMLPKHPSNPHGHFEDREIVGLHDEILADNGLNWQVDGSRPPAVGEAHRRRILELVERREAEQETWGFKDPRVCLFMNTWKSLLPDARVLVVYRSFAESAYSLHRRAAYGLLRGGMGNRQVHCRFWEVPDLALKMWLVHNRALVDFADAYPEDVLVVSFDMLRKKFPLVEAANRYWGLGLEEVPTPEVFDPKATVERSGRQPVSEERLIDEVLDTWEALERLGRRTEELTGFAVKADQPLTEEVFYKPADAYTLEREKELLGFELRYTQERLREAEKSFRERLEEVERSRQKPQARPDAAEGDSISPQRRRELEEAERNLRLVIKRMSESRMAPLFRLREGFRELERRYSK